MRNTPYVTPSGLNRTVVAGTVVTGIHITGSIITGVRAVIAGINISRTVMACSGLGGTWSKPWICLRRTGIIVRLMIIIGLCDMTWLVGRTSGARCSGARSG